MTPPPPPPRPSSLARVQSPPKNGHGDANDGDWNGGDAAPAGSGTARPKLRRDTSPGPEPSDTLSRFRYASGVSQCGPYDSRTARTPRSVFQDGSGGLPMHVADPR